MNDDDLFKSAMHKANRDIFWNEFWGWVGLTIYALPYLAFLFAIAYMIYILHKATNCG